MKGRFESIGEYYAMGIFEDTCASPFVRYSRGIRRFLENRELPPYDGEMLYPCGSFTSSMCVRYHFSPTVEVDWNELKKKDRGAAAALERFVNLYEPTIPEEHRVGGAMYTHSFANFRRIIREGLDSYENRVRAIYDNDIRAGLTDIIEGIRAFHKRSLDYLTDIGADGKLIEALKKVPFSGADTLYEAIVSWNFIYYMDGCDDIGRLDADLIDFYQGEDMTEIFREFFRNVDANNGWSGSLGPDCNELTIQCLKASRGIRRPSLELRITPDTPDDVWDAAIEAICAGGGSPSLYNEIAYQSSLQKHFPDIPKEDLLRFCGGGCTETMLTGISNVGSLDAGVNLALIFNKVMRERLATAIDFEDFYTALMHNFQREIEKVLDSISESQKLRAKYRPQPMRTLLIDDCIDKGRDFNNGGARYAWSVVNLAGTVNVLDSLLVIKKVIFTDAALNPKGLIKAIDGSERFLNYPDIPRHGTDSDEANALARRFTDDLCAIFADKVPYFGGRFLPASIQFTTYIEAGASVGATPDGRAAGMPLCDSIGAIFGNDRLGTTAMLNSAAAFAQSKMLGTPVLNVKMEASVVKKALKALALGYFEQGGMQMQITCTSREDMLDAQKNPENYPNLVVRIGGYSEYFTRLSPELQNSVINRTLCEG